MTFIRIWIAFTMSSFFKPANACQGFRTPNGLPERCQRVTWIGPFICLFVAGQVSAIAARYKSSIFIIGEWIISRVEIEHCLEGALDWCRNSHF